MSNCVKSLNPSTCIHIDTRNSASFNKNIADLLIVTLVLFSMDCFPLKMERVLSRYQSITIYSSSSTMEALLAFSIIPKEKRLIAKETTIEGKHKDFNHYVTIQ